jgi:exosortase
MTDRLVHAPPLPLVGGDSGARLQSPRLLGISTWGPIVLAALVLYIPAYLDLSHITSGTDGAAQVPVCVAVWVWLLWHKRAEFAPAEFATTSGRAEAGSPYGWLLIGLAGLMYALGRSQQFLQLELGSQLPLFMGLVLVVLGAGALRRLWFLPVFLLFLIPVPGSLLDELLVPLKKSVSSLVATVLYAGGLPITHDGVVLYVGPYQLLIADACSGLNSMIALTAIGSLYIYLVAYRSWRANLVLLAAILPIAFLVNILRVSGIALTTYFWGDAAGERFHELAAFAEIVAALACFFLLDRLLRRLQVAR